MARSSPRDRLVAAGPDMRVNLWIRAAVVGVVALTCCAAVLISSWTSVHSAVLEQKVKASSLVSTVANKIGSYAEAGKLLDKEQAVSKLRNQLSKAKQQYQTTGADSDKTKVSKLTGQLQTARKSLKDSIQKLLAKSPSTPSAKASEAKAQEGGANQQPESAGSLGFISGDRNSHHIVYNDGGYRERPYRAEDDDSGIYTEAGEHPYDTYWGLHHAVHYSDDREVYPNGYGDHYGAHYDKGPLDHYGDFFHGRTDGYDWHHHGEGSGQLPIAQFAWSAEHNPVIGDEGAKRYKPNFYMDWDGSGKNEEDTKAMGEEDFFDVGSYARKPRQQGLAQRFGRASASQQKEILALQAELVKAKGKLQKDLVARGVKGAMKQRTMTTLKTAPATKKMSGLTMRQDRNGETADLDLGRYHGCKPEQIIWGPGDDCDPLTAQMAEAVQKHQGETLAQRYENNKGGIHWTSGDVDPREDAIPLRELHGGYAGIADIKYPASEVYPTMYKPTLGLGPGDYAKAVTTKGPKPSDLRDGRPASTLRGGLKAEIKNLEGAEKKVKDSLKAHAEEAKVLKDVKQRQQKATADIAIADQVMKDAMKQTNHQDKVKLLKAATVAYKKAAHEKDAANGEMKARNKELARLPTADMADQAEVRAEMKIKDPVQRAQDLVSQEKKLRNAAKLLKQEEQQKVELAKQEKELVSGTLASVFLDQGKAPAS